MNAIYLAVLILVSTGASCLWMMYRLVKPRPHAEDLDSCADVHWRTSQPIERLLDPAEFEFLRRRGLSAARINALRVKRRQLFRMYLHSLTQEFNAVHNALKLIVVQSETDRADLARELARQRILFYRHLTLIRIHLLLSALGMEMAPTIELIRPLERLRTEFLLLAPAVSGARA